MNTGYIGCAPSFDPTFAGFGAAGAPMYMPAYGGLSIVGADAPQQTFTDKAKAFLDTPSMGVQNKWWLAGGVVVAGTWLAYSKGWLGKK